MQFGARHMPRQKHQLRAVDTFFSIGWRRLALTALASACAILVLTEETVTTANAKSPGSRYCYHGYCHRVGTLAQTDTLVGWRGYLLASYYDSCHLDRLNPCGLTSSGAVFRPDLPDNAASPLLPDGTVILAYNPKSGDASVLRITNAGPYSGKRKLDVSRAAAEKLGFSKQGVAALVISVLQSPTKAEASYVRQRVYPKVPGYIGRFKSFDIALNIAQERLDLRSNEVDEWPVISNTDVGMEIAALVPRPRLAISPSLAREMVMLRSAPRLASRGPRLLQPPRLVMRDRVKAEQPSTPSSAMMDFAPGLQRYLLEPISQNGSPDVGTEISARTHSTGASRHR